MLSAGPVQQGEAMNSSERRECKADGEWPDGYRGSVEERIDQMLDDLKALSYAAMQNDDITAAQLCLVAHEAVHAAQTELDKWGYVDPQWSSVLKMQPASSAIGRDHEPGTSRPTDPAT